MSLGATSAVEWILPVLLVMVWLALWTTNVLVRRWFLVIATAASMLCFPAGVIAGRIQMAAEENCTVENFCVSMQAVQWWGNGGYGLVTCVVLAVLTTVIEGVLTLRRRRSGHSIANEGDVQSP